MGPSLQNTAGPERPTSFDRKIAAHSGLFMLEGGILTVLGLAAIVVPVFAGLFATVFLGWLFLVAGIVGLASTLRARQAPGFVWSLLSALAAIIAGGVLIWNPLAGMVTLTYVLIAFFAIDGVLIIALAVAHRRDLSGRWEWMMLNGIVDLILAAVIIAGLPGTLIWALGLLVGIDLVFGGAALIAMALTAREQVS